MNIAGWLAAYTSEQEQMKDLIKHQRTIEQMEVGEYGFTVAWAHDLGYPVWHAPCRTMDTAIKRTGDGWEVIGVDPSIARERKRRQDMLKF